MLDGLQSVKSALVRIVVADVVSLLVGRNGDMLTPEDRNWITSVASRQRGNDNRKPTLMLLLNLAFPLFDLSSFCRSSRACLDHLDWQQYPVLQSTIAQRIVAVVNDCLNRRFLTHTPAQNFADKQPSSNCKNLYEMDPIVSNVLAMINSESKHSSDVSTIGTVRQIVEVIEALLDNLQAPRWYTSYSSPRTLRARTLKRIAMSFVYNVPLHAMAENINTLQRDESVKSWIGHSFSSSNWRYWAELANDFTAMNLSPADCDYNARQDLCDQILDCLLLENSVVASRGKHGKEEGRSKIDVPAKYVMVPDQIKRPIMQLVDVAINLEQFYALFCQTYGNKASTAIETQTLVNLFEKIVQDLSEIRNYLVMSTTREIAMIEWSARSLDIAAYYRSAIAGTLKMCNDMDRAIQNMFSEASWSKDTRTIRFMVHRPYIIDPSKLKPGASVHIPQQYQFWVATLDFRDSVSQAIAIVPWDPCRALTLLDEAIGLSPRVMKKVLDGKKGLTLWDYRRVEICSLVMRRGSFPQAVLIMERFQILFDQTDMHEGGNFSSETLPILEAASKEGNLCAQTAQGLLLAGEGAYWDVARCWAGCEKATSKGVQLLYTAAMAGDLEACTALSHIWAQCTSVDANMLKGVVREQIFAMFKIAVTSQNPQAVLNMGVMFRYGVFGLPPDPVVAIDAFLMALQGAFLSEARCVAAKHLIESVGNKRADVVATLSRLIHVDASDCSMSVSPHRIDDLSTQK